MEFFQLSEEVERLFDETEEPNIYSLDFRNQETALEIKPHSLSPAESVKMMLDLINAILFLKSHQLEPCQLRPQWVVSNHEGIWGLKHAICYRSAKHSGLQHAYDPSEFDFHEDEENELMWGLGRIWLLFYTKVQLPISGVSQLDIDELVERNVPEAKIARVIKRLLCKERRQRISFECFIEEEVFNVNETSQKFYSSILNHFTNISKFAYMQSCRMGSEKQIRTPYEVAVLRRDMREVVHTVEFLGGPIKQLIREHYDDTLGRKFAFYVLMAYQYCLMKKLDEKKVQNEIEDYSNDDRKFYSQFANRLLTLKSQVDKGRKIVAFDQLNSNQRKFLISSNDMSFEKMHVVWKSIFGTYYIESLNAMTSDHNQLSLQNEKAALYFLIARICSRLFETARIQVFSQFMSEANKEGKQCDLFNVGSFFRKLQSCQDALKLRQLRKEIRLRHFQ